MVHVIEARVERNFTVWLRFSDGVEGRVDLGGELRGQVFEPLKDPRVFGQLSLDAELGTITWPNGADFAQEFLYAAVKRAAA